MLMPFALKLKFSTSGGYMTRRVDHPNAYTPYTKSVSLLILNRRQLALIDEDACDRRKNARIVG